MKILSILQTVLHTSKDQDGNPRVLNLWSASQMQPTEPWYPAQGAPYGLWNLASGQGWQLICHPPPLPNSKAPSPAWQVAAKPKSGLSHAPSSLWSRLGPGHAPSPLPQGWVGAISSSLSPHRARLGLGYPLPLPWSHLGPHHNHPRHQIGTTS